MVNLAVADFEEARRRCADALRAVTGSAPTIVGGHCRSSPTPSYAPACPARRPRSPRRSLVPTRTLTDVTTAVRVDVDPLADGAMATLTAVLNS